MNSSIWSPLKYPYYRAFWICVFISNLGTWIQDVAASWVMTHLSTSPFVIAMLTFSSSLPMMLFSIPAGLIADKHDKRKILLFGLGLMLTSAVLIGYKVWSGNITQTVLLLLSFVLGLGSALNGPAFQTVISDLVPEEEQQNAILVFYMGTNVTRVLGPAIGGGILGNFGAGSAFWVNAMSFSGLLLFFWKWPLPKKEISQATKNHSENVQPNDWSFLFSIHNLKLWVEILVVTFCASCLWALYPTKGRVELQLDSFHYGSLLGFLGLGACVSAIFSKKLMGGATAKSLATAYMFYSVGLLCLSLAHSYALMCAGMFLSGIGWIVLATLMNMSSRQINSKSHLKATMLGIFLAVFYMGMSSGSLAWGAIARVEGLQSALGQAALLLALVGLYKVYEARKHSH